MCFSEKFVLQKVLTNHVFELNLRFDLNTNVEVWKVVSIVCFNDSVVLVAC